MGNFSSQVGFLFTHGVAIGADPFFLFEEDDRRGDGAVVAVLVPGRVAAVAEDDLVRGRGVPAAAIDADGGFAGFAAFGFWFFEGWRGGCCEGGVEVGVGEGLFGG